MKTNINSPKKLSKKDKLAACLIFAVANFKNQPIMGSDGKMTTWHQWFKDVLKDNGYAMK
jgi:hypothetical protein